MARDFDGSSDYLEYAGTRITAAPLTLAAWFNTDSAAANQTVVAFSRSTTTTEGFRLQVTATGDLVSAVTTAGGTARTASTSTSFTTGTWHHGCAVFASTTSRAAYIDGGSKGTNGTSSSPTNIDRTTVGVRYSSGSLTDHFDGRIGEVGIWNVALTDDEVAVLARGVSPRRVRPNSLVYCWRVMGKTSPEPPFAGSGEDALTVSGSPALAAHPRVLDSSGWPRIVAVAAAAGGGITGPLVGGGHLVKGGGPLLRGRLVRA